MEAVRAIFFRVFLKDLGRWTLDCWRSSTQAWTEEKEQALSTLEDPSNPLLSEESVLRSQGSLGPPSPLGWKEGGGCQGSYWLVHDGNRRGFLIPLGRGINLGHTLWQTSSQGWDGPFPSLILMNLSGMGAAKLWEGLSEGINLHLDVLGGSFGLDSSTVEVEGWSLS